MKGMSDNMSSISQLLLLDAAEEMKLYPNVHVEDTLDMEADLTLKEWNGVRAFAKEG